MPTVALILHSLPPPPPPPGYRASQLTQLRLGDHFTRGRGPPQLRPRPLAESAVGLTDFSARPHRPALSSQQYSLVARGRFNYSASQCGVPIIGPAMTHLVAATSLYVVLYSAAL